ncbi:MAG: heme ABC exporter ATP-binding protein CcmA [Bacillota bacterium]|nr:heme ABC exporter ATP-binding protein CcmA [Bacillota bacterium]
MIRAEGLGKRIGDRQILSGISLDLPTGEFLTIFGPNGAGKTTLLRILCLLTKASEGRLWIDGVTVDDDSAQALRRSIGVLSHHTYLYDDLTAAENLRFYGRMYGVADVDRRIPEALEEVGLALYFHDPVRHFSRGMQQRLAIARAILHQPSLLFLDEPYTGLDPQGSAVLSRILARLKTDRRTVVMITHNFEEGLSLADQVMILSRGKVVYQAPRGEVDRAAFPAEYLARVGGVAGCPS